MKNALFILTVFILTASCSEKVIKPVAVKPEKVIKPVAAKEVTATAPAPTSLKYDRDAVKALHDEACYKCHDLYSPKDFTDEQWVGIMKSMGPKAGFTPEQSALVLNYLTSEN